MWKIVSAFGDEAYWLARLANYGLGTDTLNSLTVDADGTVTVATMLVGARLPAVVTRAHRGDVQMVRSGDLDWG